MSRPNTFLDSSRVGEEELTGCLNMNIIMHLYKYFFGPYIVEVFHSKMIIALQNIYVCSMQVLKIQRELLGRESGMVPCLDSL